MSYLSNSKSIIIFYFFNIHSHNPPISPMNDYHILFFSSIRLLFLYIRLFMSSPLLVPLQLPSPPCSNLVLSVLSIVFRVALLEWLRWMSSWQVWNCNLFRVKRPIVFIFIIICTPHNLRYTRHHWFDFMQLQLGLHRSIPSLSANPASTEPSGLFKQLSLPSHTYK